jgi:hypothetical protein
VGSSWPCPEDGGFKEYSIVMERDISVCFACLQTSSQAALNSHQHLGNYPSTFRVDLQYRGLVSSTSYLSSILTAAATGIGPSISGPPFPMFSSGGGADFSDPRFWSNHLSMSSERPTNGRLPRRRIMSSLKPGQSLVMICGEQTDRVMFSFSSSSSATLITSSRCLVNSCLVRA